MAPSVFDQAPPQQASGSERTPSVREAAQRSVDRVSHALEKVFADAKKNKR